MKFSTRSLALKLSETKKYKPVIEKLKIEGKKIIDFGHGDINLKVSNKTLRGLVDALNQANNYKYSNSQGNSDLLEYVANQNSVGKKNVIIGPGAKMLLKMVSELLFDKNENIITIAPYWPTYKSQIEMSQAKIIPFYLESDLSFNKNKFVKFVNSIKNIKAFIINNPNNPSGKVLSKGEVEFICRLMWKKKIIIISDEVYSRYVFLKNTYVSILDIPGAMANLDKLIIINSSSKNLCMSGFRIAYLISNDEFIKKSIYYMSQTISNVPNFIQIAYLSELKNKKHQEINLTLIKKRVEILKKSILKSKNLKLCTYGGTIYLFPKITAKLTINMSEFILNLLTLKNVSVLSGKSFGYLNHIRICIGNCETNEIEKGIKRIDDYINEIKK